jgi:hypothetical protein
MKIMLSIYQCMLSAVLYTFINILKKSSISDELKILHLDWYCIPYFLLSLVRTREVQSKTIFARKQTRDKQDGGNSYYILTAGIRAAGIGQSVVKCNCQRLKYLVLHYKNVIALILRNISAIILYHNSIYLYNIKYLNKLQKSIFFRYWSVERNIHCLTL